MEQNSSSAQYGTAIGVMLLLIDPYSGLIVVRQYLIFIPGTDKSDSINPATEEGSNPDSGSSDG